MAKIEVFDPVFDPEFCTYLYRDAKAQLAAGGAFTRSNFNWDPQIVRASQPVLVKDHTREQAALVLKQLRDRGIAGPRNYSVMTYAWTRLSYIPRHDDGHRDEAITVYLNPEWDRNWGGLFLYVDAEDGQMRGLAPRFNLGLRNVQNLDHATTPVTPDAPEPRFTLQLFPRDPV